MRCGLAGLASAGLAIAGARWGQRIRTAPGRDGWCSVWAAPPGVRLDSGLAGLGRAVLAGMHAPCRARQRQCGLCQGI